MGNRRQRQLFGEVPKVDTDRECTVFCQSLQHASQAVDCVIAMSSKNYAIDEVKVYFRHLCWNFHNLSDAFGRTVLHAAASVGNVELIEWLIDAYGCDPDRVDGESGWSALHRACFFGQLGAVWILLQKGASVDLKDHEGLTPLDILVRDRVPWAKYLPTNPCSLHVWGEDENLSLGLGSTSVASTPKTHPRFPLSSGIQDIVIERFHSAFLTKQATVFVSGHGPGGRLGTGDGKDLMVPEEVPTFRRVNTKIVQVAAGQDHTIFLDSEGNVFTCGSNKYHQLGFSARPEKLLEPQLLNPKAFLLNILESIQGVGAGKYHSALYTERALYTWGLNAGQLGHPKYGERFTVLPRKVSAIDLPSENISSPSISAISCGEGAIAVLTTDGDVYLVHDYNVKKVVSKQKDITKIVVVGGNIDHERLLGESSKCTDLKLLTLSDTGYISLWEGRELLHSRVHFETVIKVADFALPIDGSLHIVSVMGEVYCCYIGRSVSTEMVGWSSKTKSKKHCSRTVTVNNLRRVPHLHRAVAVRCDPRGKRFAALQNSANVGVRSLNKCDLEKSRSSEEFIEMTETAANLSDVHVTCVSPETGDSRQFDLHSVILRARSAYFRKILSTYDLAESYAERIEIRIEADCDRFASLLPMIYGGIMDSAELLPADIEFLQAWELDFGASIERDFATDVRIQCSDGETIGAHRCILAARSEYFRCMFTSDWREACNRELVMPVPSETLRAVLDFMYTDTCPPVKSSLDINFVCDVLAFADHLLLSRLKSICENELFSRLITVQTVCEVFELAKCYQADKLSQVCADFICVNLTAILESQSCEYLSTDSWRGLSAEYRADFRDCHRRIIGGSGHDPSKEHIEAIYKMFRDILVEDDTLIEKAQNQRLALPKVFPTRFSTAHERRFRPL
ncbi:inhibitor of Bruton tyrosine kinase [Galendromus occidentalis]|uniref:Inhibitor of Bruton tyrosine kinase n=1 Tax=Galendromus occidentalis TaxID=34638 RepID=A0AAJ6VVE9_9ACAR|nr:inhibitor of Bruton tyrosine kinase [Galendromus occidentalis]